MLTILLLTGIEKLINIALKSDPITQAGLTELAGKTLRLKLDMPNFAIDTYFYDDHLRFEPVSTNPSSVFEANFSNQQSSQFGNRSEASFANLDGTNAYANDRLRAEQTHNAAGNSTPDCTIHVKNPAELLNLLRDTGGNLPIAGDYKVLMQVKQLLAGFDPDIAGQLEPLIGVPLASQLGLVIRQLKGNFSHTAKQSFYDVADWANDVAGNGKPDPQMQAEADDLKQQLLKLRADVEREEARLQAIKAEQARLKNF